MTTQDRSGRAIRRTAPTVTVLVALLTLCGCTDALPHRAGAAADASTVARLAGSSEPVPPRDVGYAATLPGVAAPACRNAPAGWATTEARRTSGVTDLPTAAAAERAARRGVAGYLDRTAVVCGERVGLHLSAPVATSVVVEALRVGSYGGHDARVVWRSAPVSVGPQPVLPPVAHRTQDNAWPVTLTVRPNPGWAPGLYMLRFHPDASTHLADTYQSLVVPTSGKPSTYLAVESDMTQLAYDAYGGSSLYFGPARPATRANEVAAREWVASVHRGLAGAGLVQLLARDVPLALLLARHGLVADWTTDTLLDAAPAQLRGRTTVVLPGHSEYWTRRAYDGLSAAVAAGTNLAVLGANEIYWQARVVRDRRGAVAAMVVYRRAALDPTTDRSDTTTQWQDAPLGRDPANLTGLGKGGVGITGSATVADAPAWLLAGTGLRRGDVLPGVYGNEGDTATDPRRPRDDVIVMQAQARTAQGALTPVATVLHVAPSGALVFDAGTTDWLCGATASCPDGPRSRAVVRDLDRVTVDLLLAMARPRAGMGIPARSS